MAVCGWAVVIAVSLIAAGIFVAAVVVGGRAEREFIKIRDGGD